MKSMVKTMMMIVIRISVCMYMYITLAVREKKNIEEKKTIRVANE